MTSDQVVPPAKGLRDGRTKLHRRGKTQHAQEAVEAASTVDKVGAKAKAKATSAAAAEAKPTASEVVAEAASTADKVVAEATSTADEVLR